MKALRAVNNFLASASLALAMLIIFIMVAALFLSAATRFIIVNIVALLSACVFFKAGLDATMMYFNLGQVMEIEISIPIWWMFLAFPVGFLILALTSLELLLDNIKNLIRN